MPHGIGERCGNTEPSAPNATWLPWANKGIKPCVVAGQHQVKSPRFVKTRGATRVFNQTTFDRAHQIAGWKGYVTNLPLTAIGAAEPGTHIYDGPQRMLGVFAGYNTLVLGHYCGSLAKYAAAFYERQLRFQILILAF